MRRVPANLLADWVEKVLVALRVSSEEARIVADVLVGADLRGVHSHGVSRLPDYAERIKRGSWRAGAPLKVLTERKGLVLADACSGIGPVMAFRSMKLAIDRATEFGIAAVLLRRAGHFGRAGHYAELAAERQMVGLVISNASPSISPWGGATRVLGNNPWAVAVPRRNAQPIVLDMALSVVARGKIRLARDRGERIPLGWALDAEGNPTDDPDAALQGTLLPIGGYKGYGMALIFDLLTGALSGSGVGTEVRNPQEHEYEQNVGQLFMAINVEAVRPLEHFYQDVERLVSMVKNVPLARGASEVLLPGEPEARRLSEQKHGIELPDHTFRKLDQLANELGIELSGV